MQEKGKNNIEPIRLNLYTWGYSGPQNRGTEFYLEKLICQNIAFCAYHEAKTVTEIAKELGVATAYVEDELHFLVENGFINKIAGDRYLTNIFISNYSEEILESKHKLFTEYSKYVAEIYAPKIINAFAEEGYHHIYIPKDDINFLNWTVVSIGCAMSLFFDMSHYAKMEKYSLRLSDGGNFLSRAEVINDDLKLSFDKRKYEPYEMVPYAQSGADKPFRMNQLITSFNTTDRKVNPSDRYSYFYWLYEYMTGALLKTDENVDKFKILYDEGLIVSEGDSEYINLIIVEDVKNTRDCFEVPDSLKSLSLELDNKLFELLKNQHPEHMQDFCRVKCTNNFADQSFVVYVLERLLENGTLQPLTEIQKKTVNTIMFRCDALPK